MSPINSKSPNYLKNFDHLTADEQIYKIDDNLNYCFDPKYSDDNRK